ncbi:MAG: phosphate ABC transporter substrate-binding protein PstS [Alicyclobacillus sp.]|nr:phosphate ABC transporter substrate-binding protein PstS [Alicyclobacillus sp.]
MRTSGWVGTAGAVFALLAAAGCGTVMSGSQAQGGAGQNTAGAARTTGITLNETGSSLLYPLFNTQWIAAYRRVHPSVHITAASTGSGTGIAQAIANTVQIGASDAYLSEAQMQQNPTMVNIPLAVSAQQVMYNLPGLGKRHLNLSGDVLARIYTGTLRYWDDPAIAKLNKGVKLPHHAITAVHRSDSSGDTFLFTQYLSDTYAPWRGRIGYGTSVSWPAVAGSVGAQGNDGVVQALASNPYSIGYVGISWLDQAVKQGLGYAALKNKSGHFVLPTASSIQAATRALVAKVPADERISLVDAPGAGSYPIVNFEYAIVNTKQPGPTAKALKEFLGWAIDPKGGNQARYLKPVHFLPLPASIEAKSQAQIDKIGR